MEHVKITQLPDGYIHMAPDTGYKLRNIKSERLYSEVETRVENEKEYEAVTINNSNRKEA